ncbi:hypothetical protein B0H12DRAFT_1074798 [Mycena haematopus]|nr:hypothetical protein B0H12DRAFT_1074798 [Mycena haematopus]
MRIIVTVRVDNSGLWETGENQNCHENQSPLEAILQFREHEEAWVKGFQNQLESAKSVQKWPRKCVFSWGGARGPFTSHGPVGCPKKISAACGGPWDIPLEMGHGISHDGTLKVGCPIPDGKAY